MPVFATSMLKYFRRERTSCSPNPDSEEESRYAMKWPIVDNITYSYSYRVADDDDDEGDLDDDGL